METEADIRARVTFEIELKKLQGNHSSFSQVSFVGVELCRRPEWVGMLIEALCGNTTCKELDLTGTGLDDGAVQRIAVALFDKSKCPQLVKLHLGGNGLTPVGETILQGLRKLRPSLDASVGDAPLADGFVHEKQLVVGKTAWRAESLKVDGAQNEFWCPEEVTKGGERVKLTRGFQGPNGTSAPAPSGRPAAALHWHARVPSSRRAPVPTPACHMPTERLPLPPRRVQVRPGGLRDVPRDGQPGAARARGPRGRGRRASLRRMPHAGLSRRAFFCRFCDCRLLCA